MGSANHRSVLRSTVRATNPDRGIERRQFIRTAAGGTAGIVLGAACKTTTTTEARVTVLTQPPPSSVGDTTATVPDTVAPPATKDNANSLGTVWRLSSRNQRSPCAACKAHAAHRYFVSDAAAEAGRAHAGCACEIRAQQITMGQLGEWFAEGDEVFDDRWT
jgi:hypothetical protein